jgi:aminomethyltransferase
MEVKKKPLPRKLVGFEVTGRGIARHGYPLRDVDGRDVGSARAAAPDQPLARTSGLGYLPAGMAEVGTRFLVDCRGKNVEAVVAKTPFYKRAK